MRVEGQVDASRREEKRAIKEGPRGCQRLTHPPEVPEEGEIVTCGARYGGGEMERKRQRPDDGEDREGRGDGEVTPQMRANLRDTRPPLIARL